MSDPLSQKVPMTNAAVANNPVVDIDDVEFLYGRRRPGHKPRRILNGVTLQIDPGEMLCLLGPSGCGKTTLVNLVMGELIPKSGSVSIMGETAPFPHARRSIGFMPQDEALYDDVTAEENLRFFGDLYGVERSRLKQRLDELFDLMRLSDDRKKLVSDYSGGMKRRLSLAVALVHDPKLLVLDEPTVGLDPEHRLYIWNHLEKLTREGVSVLLTTHVMDEAERCNRIAMIYEGRVIADGSPAAIKEATGTSELESAFLKLEEHAQGSINVADENSGEISTDDKRLSNDDPASVKQISNEGTADSKHSNEDTTSDKGGNDTAADVGCGNAEIVIAASDGSDSSIEHEDAAKDRYAIENEAKTDTADDRSSNPGIEGTAADDSSCRTEVGVKTADGKEGREDA